MRFRNSLYCGSMMVSLDAMIWALTHDMPLMSAVNGALFGIIFGLWLYRD